MTNFKNNSKITKSIILKNNKTILPSFKGSLPKFSQTKRGIDRVGPVKLPIKEFGEYPIRPEKIKSLRLIDDEEETKIIKKVKIIHQSNLWINLFSEENWFNVKYENFTKINNRKLN